MKEEEEEEMKEENINEKEKKQKKLYFVGCNSYYVCLFIYLTACLLVSLFGWLVGFLLIFFILEVETLGCV